jgi:hypothetical protein
MPPTERERLVRAICDSVRRFFPEQRVDKYFQMRQRLNSTRIEVLRNILEDDLFSVVDSGCEAAESIADVIRRDGPKEVLQ